MFFLPFGIFEPPQPCHCSVLAFHPCANKDGPRPDLDHLCKSSKLGWCAMCHFVSGGCATMVHGEDPLRSRGSSTAGIGKTSQQTHLATASTFPVLDAGQTYSAGVRALNGESPITEQNV